MKWHFNFKFNEKNYVFKCQTKIGVTSHYIISSQNFRNMFCWFLGFFYLKKKKSFPRFPI